MSSIDYKILGVDSSASDRDVRSAYKKLAVKYHPDKTRGDVDKFKSVHQAYRNITKSRKAIDKFPATGIVPEFIFNMGTFGMGSLFDKVFGTNEFGTNDFGANRIDDAIRYHEKEIERLKKINNMQEKIQSGPKESYNGVSYQSYYSNVDGKEKTFTRKEVTKDGIVKGIEKKNGTTRKYTRDPDGNIKYKKYKLKIDK